jgi:cellulose synthase/poly-beta-1,6-N-acetylglucosamine synthase-like glycosyltransferase
LVLEEDDVRTIEAAKALHLDGRFEILCVPSSQPRTKPKACNYALRFVRGAYVVIYDAEDRPEPDQLKKAVAAFRSSGRKVACYQARLNFYNSHDNWLTRMFALEYALWFDFLLPGLDRLGVPLPLGGTSNHFRTEVLRGLHGWDAFNVTEDADLGMRLAQCGYQVVPLDSSTYEEAAKDFGNWLRQRSRWIKGYMQTWLVHLRSPKAFARKVGWAPFGGFVLFIGGAIFTGLICPFFWALFVVWLWTGVGPFGGIFGSASLAVSIASLLIGNGILTVLSILAPVKRRWLSLAPYGVTVFIYWLLISVAAYKALAQLVTRPFYWEKTRHGLTRSTHSDEAREPAWQAA